jgi:hypothetical protein
MTTFRIRVRALTGREQVNIMWIASEKRSIEVHTSQLEDPAFNSESSDHIIERCNPYKLQLLQALSEEVKVSTVGFWENFITQLVEDNFSDEATFHQRGTNRTGVSGTVRILIPVWSPCVTRPMRMMCKVPPLS